MHPPPLSAIIPTWNARRYLPACLAALRAQLSPDDEIILVDNASLDGAAAWARQHAPDVRLMVLPHNRGFAGGTNAGIQAARHPTLLLCNDDALVEPDCVAALRHTLHSQPEAGAVAGVLTFSRHPEIVASAGMTFHRNGLALDHLPGAPVDALPPRPVEVFGASGGLALLRRAMLDDIGLFEETFFCYLEDADLAWRARLRGWRCLLAPAARARHVYSASGSAFKHHLLARNRIRMLVRCLPAPLLWDGLPAMLRYDALALAYAAARRTPTIARGRFDALRELPALLAQRRAIQARRTAPLHTLARWIEAPLSPLATLRLQRRIQQATSKEDAPR
jgi:GT2 family glycosyltransferase